MEPEVGMDMRVVVVSVVVVEAVEEGGGDGGYVDFGGHQKLYCG